MRISLLFYLSFLLPCAINAESATFRITSIQGTINGEKFTLSQEAFETEVIDSSFLVLGLSKEIKIGVKLMLPSTVIMLSKIYMPSFVLFLVGPGSSVDSSTLDPSFLTLFSSSKKQEEQEYKSSGQIGQNKYDIRFIVGVDGSKLRYIDVSPQLAYTDTFFMRVKNLIINRKNITLDKEFALQETITPSLIKVGVYKNTPVFIDYFMFIGMLNGRPLPLAFARVTYDLKKKPKVSMTISYQGYSTVCSADYLSKVYDQLCIELIGKLAP